MNPTNSDYSSDKLMRCLEKSFYDTSLIVHSYVSGRFGRVKKQHVDLVAVTADVHKIRYYASLEFGCQPSMLIESGFDYLKDCSSAAARKHMACLDNELHAYRVETLENLDKTEVRNLSITIVNRLRELLRRVYEKKFYGHLDVSLYRFRLLAGEPLTEELAAKMSFHSDPILRNIRAEIEELRLQDRKPSLR